MPDRDRDYTPRRRAERDRRPVKNTIGRLAGSQLENARRYLSGELVRALAAVERYWRPGYNQPSLLAEGGGGTVKLFGPGRAPLEEEPDFYTLRFKTRGAIIGAESGMFVLKAHQIVMPDAAFFLAVAHLRADALCCANCAEMPEGHDRFSEPAKHRLPKGERCYLNEVFRSPLGIWVTHATMVVKAEDVPAEHTHVALALFDRSVVYETDELPTPKQAPKPGRPKKDVS